MPCSPRSRSNHARVVASALFASLTAVVCLSCTATEVQPATSAATEIPVVEALPEPRVVNLGVAAGRRTGQTPIDALDNTEQIANRRFDTLRAYAFWDSEFPDLRHQAASRDDRLLHLSVNARRTDGTVVPWQAIASAADDDPVYLELKDWVTRLATYDAPLRVTFHHEADIEPEFGTPQEFVAAWQRFATMLEEAAPDIETVWVMTAFSMAQNTAEQFWPGEDHVDLIGADAFNWFGCRGTPEAWRSPREVIAPLLAFGANHPGKSLMLAELGSDEDPNDPQRKAAWLAELATMITEDEYKRLDTVVFFHNDHDADSDCEWWLDSSPATANAFGTLAALPSFGGDVAPPATVPCPVFATAASSVTDLALVDGDGDGRFDFEFGGENRFLGIGDQSADGADHRVLLQFDPFDAPPAGSTIELRVRVGERQPLLSAPVELRLLDDFETMSAAFADPGQLLAPALFDAATVGGHHVFDLTSQIDPSQRSVLRLQLTSPPAANNGQAALYIGMGDANRSIDRPTLIVRLCP